MIYKIDAPTVTLSDFKHNMAPLKLVALLLKFKVIGIPTYWDHYCIVKNQMPIGVDADYGRFTVSHPMMSEPIKI